MTCCVALLWVCNNEIWCLWELALRRTLYLCSCSNTGTDVHTGTTSYVAAAVTTSRQSNSSIITAGNTAVWASRTYETLNNIVPGIAVPGRWYYLLEVVCYQLQTGPRATGYWHNSREAQVLSSLDASQLSSSTTGTLLYDSVATWKRLHWQLRPLLSVDSFFTLQVHFERELRFLVVVLFILHARLNVSTRRSTAPPSNLHLFHPPLSTLLRCLL